MEKEKPKIQVRDVGTQQVLFECEIADAEKAYQFAAEMEELGLDIEVLTPSLGDTLSASLGLTKEQHQDYVESLEAEMNDHDGSCCFTKDDEDKIIH